MITWNTIQGVLGSVYNYQSYNFYLNATSNVTSNITYSDLTLSLPDGMYIKNNYIVGVPSGNSNLLSGNVSIVTANFSSNIFPINFYSNLYINWNLY